MLRMLHNLKIQHDDLYQAPLTDVVPYHRMYGKQYCLPSLTVYDPQELAELHTASELVSHIFQKSLNFVQQYLPDRYLVEQLGLHPALIPAARQQVPICGIQRQDWILGPQGMKCIENNADTPTGIPESAYLERNVLSRFGYGHGPSEQMDSHLRQEFTEAVKYYGQQGLGDKITFTCFEWHIEDYGNTRYLMTLCEECGIRSSFAPLEELEIIAGQGLFHKGERIQILYRLYPLEFLVQDREEDTDFRVGEALLELVEKGEVALINPPENIISQSKGFMATIWSLYEHNDLTPDYCGFQLFDERECEIIERYLLPTYFTDAPFQHSGESYVAKGYWGREGKGTHLYGAEQEPDWELPSPPSVENELDEETSDYYEHQKRIYQKLWPMQSAQVQTEAGDYEGYLLTGIFVIGGKFAGILPRIGERVTGDMAYYCPAVVLDTNH